MVYVLDGYGIAINIVDKRICAILLYGVYGVQILLIFDEVYIISKINIFTECRKLYYVLQKIIPKSDITLHHKWSYIKAFLLSNDDLYRKISFSLPNIAGSSCSCANDWRLILPMDLVTKNFQINLCFPSTNIKEFVTENRFVELVKFQLQLHERA